MRSALIIAVVLPSVAIAQDEQPYRRYHDKMRKHLTRDLQRRIEHLERRVGREPENADVLKREIERLQTERPLPVLSKRRKLRRGEWGVYKGELFGVAKTEDGWVVRETVAYTERVILRGFRRINEPFSVDCPLIVVGFARDTDEYDRFLPILEPFPHWRYRPCPGWREVKLEDGRFDWR